MAAGPSLSGSGSDVVWDYNAVDSDDEDLENSETYRNSARTATLIVIDASSEMFRPWAENEDSYYRAAIKCCKAILKGKVICSPKDKVGIMLLGTTEKKNPIDFPNIYMLQDLAEIKVKRIEELDKLSKSEDFDRFPDNIGSAEKYDMAEFFWSIKILFDEAKAGSFSKKILYFTCEDNPHATDVPHQQESINKFKDLRDVEMTVVSFRDEFDYNKFYKHILPHQSSIIFPKDMDTLLKIVRVRQRAKRPITNTTMELVPGMKISVGVYTLARQAKAPAAINVNRRNNEIVTKKVNKFHATTGQTITKADEVKMVEFKGEKVVFTQEEVKALKEPKYVGIKLIGFINHDQFQQFSWYRSAPFFVYPDDDMISGSKELFASLYRRCLALKKVGLVKMKLTRAQNPKIACLVPSGLELSEDAKDKTGTPSGFHLFPIPFSDEIKPKTFEKTAEASPQAVDLMTKIIKKLSNKAFDVTNVYNPALHHKYKQIEEKALDEEEESTLLEENDEFVDFTEPNEPLMLQRVGELSKQFNQEVSLVSGSFAKAFSTALKKPVKQVDMGIEVRNKRVDKLTVDVLRNFLESKHIDCYRKVKAQLVAAVYDYFEQQ